MPINSQVTTKRGPVGQCPTGPLGFAPNSASSGGCAGLLYRFLNEFRMTGTSLILR